VRTYFYQDALTVAVLKPTGTEMPAEEVGVAEVAGEVGQVKKVVLDNGLTLLLKKNPNYPLVSLQAYCKGGVRYENDRNSGLFNFTAQMLLKGTKKRTAEQIAREIDTMGGSIKASGGNDLSHISVEVLREYLEKGLDIMADVLQNPIFDPEEMEKERKVILAKIDQQEDNWRTQAEAFFRKTFFRSHPYRFMPIGSPTSVEALTRRDLEEVHKRHYVPNNMVLAIFGDIDPDGVENLVKKKFGRMKRKELLFPRVPEEPPLTANIQDTLITNRQQAVIFMGYPGMTLGAPDWPTMRVIDGITSGIGYPSGWLHNTLRGGQLVYFVHAWNDARSDPGYYAIQAASTPATADTALKVILEKQELVKGDAVTDQELEQAKRACIVMQGLRYNQTNSAQASLAATNEIRGLGYDYADDFEERINAVTKEDVKRVANKYFQRYGLIMTRPKG